LGQFVGNPFTFLKGLEATRGLLCRCGARRGPRFHHQGR
jgi:hypothetical protein